MRSTVPTEIIEPRKTPGAPSHSTETPEDSLAEIAAPSRSPIVTTVISPATIPYTSTQTVGWIHLQDPSLPLLRQVLGDAGATLSDETLELCFKDESGITAAKEREATLYRFGELLHTPTPLNPFIAQQTSSFAVVAGHQLITFTFGSGSIAEHLIPELKQCQFPHLRFQDAEDLFIEILGRSWQRSDGIVRSVESALEAFRERHGRKLKGLPSASAQTMLCDASTIRKTFKSYHTGEQALAMDLVRSGAPAKLDSKTAYLTSFRTKIERMDDHTARVDKVWEISKENLQKYKNTVLSLISTVVVPLTVAWQVSQFDKLTSPRFIAATAVGLAGVLAIWGWAKRTKDQ